MARLMSPRRRQRGLALVEMALILPLLFVLVFGVIEYGWLFFKYQQIASVARVACRYAITQPATTANALTLVDTLMTNANLEDSGYSKTCTNTDFVAPGTFITVTVTVPYANIRLTGFPLPLPEDLVGETTMAKEGPP